MLAREVVRVSERAVVVHGRVDGKILLAAKIVVIKAVLSLALTPGSFLVSYSGISYLLLLVLATGLAIRN